MTTAPDEIALLSPAECRELRDAVHQARAHWRQRHPRVPFFTLGAASYLDAAQGRADRYRALSAQLNPVLDEHFNSLYGKLLHALAGMLSGSAAYDERYARPGFHIYLADAAFAQPVAQIHCDLQYRHLSWDHWEGVDLRSPISFTLSIALPREGGGLNYWPIERSEATEMGKEELARRFKETAPQFHAYQTGHLVLHSGQMIHQAVLMKDVHPDDERITLQGHGIRAGDTWVLYW